jgi:hypothetical protein
MNLLDDMKKCKTINQCFEVAMMDAREEEEIGSWLVCIQEMFGAHSEVMVLGDKLKLEGFDVKHGSILAICIKGKLEAGFALDSVVFPKVTKAEKLWLQAWDKYSETLK